MSEPTTRGTQYHIKIKGAPDQFISDWYSGITIIPQENAETLLVGQFTDQPALRGFLEQLWNLNFTILSFQRIETESR